MFQIINNTTEGAKTYKNKYLLFKFMFIFTIQIPLWAISQEGQSSEKKVTINP